MGRPARRLARLLSPRTIAVIGGTPAARVVEQCNRMGFGGPVWPVHPSRDEVAGRPVFRSVADLPEAPDAAFVGVNRHATVDAVADLAACGAGGAVCYAAGFLEAKDGAKLQQELVEAASGMPIIGPNCYGAINFLDGAPLWPDQHGGLRLGPSARGVAIVTQSSNIAISITMQRRGLPVAYVVTAGNQAQLGVAELAGALLDDDRVSAIGLHIEGFESVPAYEDLARSARQRRVPVAVVKVGRSTRGSAAALTHTASIAGSDAGADAFLRRLGFARANGIPELLETLKLLHVHGPLDGPRLGAMCCSGGEASIVADAAEEAGVVLPELTTRHADDVAETVHPLVTVANPFDYHTFSWGDSDALTKTFTTFARDTYDATLLMLDFPRPDRCADDDWDVTLQAFERAMHDTGRKGIVAATLAENLPEHRARALIDRGLAPLGGIREALGAVKGAAMIAAAWSEGEYHPLLPVSCTSGDAVALDEATSKRLLSEYSVAVPEGSVVQDAETAVDFAGSLGGSVAVKALGVAHKTECGAVRTGLSDPDDIRVAARDLLALGNGILVERFEAGAVVELIVGITRDTQLGLMLTIGSGGVLVELLADTATLLLPVGESDVRRALADLRCAPLLQGHRGREAADVDAAVDAVLGIARFAVDHQASLEELDVNPLAVAPEGRGARALDALVRLRSSAA
ncbi:MAG: acetate--CoA ligase family protein [Gammaproteobacteria bacterium]|nr:acetate--CoA ligase family protein [Gammaproteobacteria bacterium]